MGLFVFGLPRWKRHRLIGSTTSLGLYKILFYFESFVHKSIVLSFLPPTCVALTVAILLHDYCKIYDPPSTFLVYATHHTIFAITISCKGQDEPSLCTTGRRVVQRLRQTVRDQHGPLARPRRAGPPRACGHGLQKHRLRGAGQVR